MSLPRLFAAVLLFVIGCAAPSFGQTNPGFVNGQVLTADQLNQAFARKQDLLSISIGGTPAAGYVPVASSATAAAWAQLNFSGLSGVIATNQLGGTVGGDLVGTLPNPGVAKINGVAVTGTPAAGYVPAATSSTAAAWAQLNFSGLSGVIATGQLGGTVGGDLSGTLPDPSVAKLNGVAVSGTPVAGAVPIATNAFAAGWALLSIVPAFDVANYVNGAAGAVAACTAAGGGWIYFGAGTFIETALTIPNGCNVLCAGIEATTIEAGSATGDIFDVVGYSSILHCGFLSSGTPGTSQTAGSFVNLTGAWAEVGDVWCNGAYNCLTLNNGIARIHDVVVNHLTRRTVAAGASAILCLQGGSVQVSRLTVGTTSDPSSEWASYGVLATGANGTCPLQISDSAILEVQTGLAALPAAGKAVCIKSSNNYYDNNLQPVILQPQANTGLICNASFVGDSFNMINTGQTPAGLLADTNTNGGTIDQLTITGTNNISYTTGNGSCITLSGSGLVSAQITGNNCGSTNQVWYNGVTVINGAGNFDISHNSLMNSGGTTIFCNSTGNNLVIEFNRLNGGNTNTSACNNSPYLIGNNQ
jgi:hypothetical protein